MFPRTGDRVVAIGTEIINDNISEVAAIEIVNYQTTGLQYQSYLKPFNALTENERKNILPTIRPRTIKTALESFLKFVGDSIIIAHNSASSIKTLNAQLKKHLPGCELISLKRAYCTRQMLEEVYSESKSLDEACKKFGIETLERVNHGAYVDSKKCAELYIALHNVNLARIKGKSLKDKLLSRKQYLITLGEKNNTL